LFLKLDGNSILIGNLNIGGHSINNVGDPANAQDFVTKKDVDEALARDSDLVTQGKKVINMKVPTARNEGATKGYANSSVDNISSFVKYDGSIPVISELT
jgi:cytochrome c peroxidase